jgi:dienelactone hydrolase
MHRSVRRGVFWLIMLGVSLLILAGCGRKDPAIERVKIVLGPDLPTARQRFQTTTQPCEYQPDGPAPVPPAGALNLIRYRSPAGELAAYVTPDPGDGKRHPAVVWAHGGFGGIDETYWTPGEPQNPEALRGAGCVVMYPSWRGENENPGHFEMFGGELEDALAAVDHVRRLPYVDPSRVYFAGHSTGGTMALLVAESTNKIRAAFSFGGCPDLHLMVGSDQETPFDDARIEEYYIRSPICFVSTLRVPTFYFEGEKSVYPPAARDMAARAKKAGKLLSVYIIQGGDHFSILSSGTKLMAAAIFGDIGPKCGIRFRETEAQNLFDFTTQYPDAKFATPSGNPPPATP